MIISINVIQSYQPSKQIYTNEKDIVMYFICRDTSRDAEESREEMKK